MIYKFETYKKEHLRAAWLSGEYTDDELINKYGDAYEYFCYKNGYEMEKLPQLESVHVVGLSNGIIKATTSCARKDGQRYAKYYRSIGYHARVLNDDELEELLERQRKESWTFTSL